MSAVSSFDIIGDIHGQADALERLLDRLGYHLDGGVWRYPGGGRQAIFVGDLIDRNPAAKRVIETVRAMQDAGCALVVAGNHEFNAVAYYTQDPARPGSWLREHNDRNTLQHQVFLDEMAADATFYHATIEWFKRLPLWLDLGDLRIVHACWAPVHQEIIKPLLGPNNNLTDALLVAACRKGSREHEAIECLLKGVEAELPCGITFTDKTGIVRNKSRLRWWLSAAPQALADALLGPESIKQTLAGYEWQGHWPSDGYAAAAVPVFVGHYWLSGMPALQASNVVCVDYSAAKPGEKLVAYRWNGEQSLRDEGFVWVAT